MEYRPFTSCQLRISTNLMDAFGNKLAATGFTVSASVTTTYVIETLLLLRTSPYLWPYDPRNELNLDLVKTYSLQNLFATSKWSNDDIKGMDSELNSDYIWIKILSAY